MKPAPMIAAAAMLAYAGWMIYQDNQDTSQSADVVDGLDFSGATQGTATFFDSLTGGILKISDMAKVTTAHVANGNMQAFLRVIRAGEGTSDAAGYSRIFGGQTFSSFADHPRIKVTKNGYTSTAAGAYQIIASTWDETKRIMKLSDFSPRSQDLAALGRIAARGALEDAKAGQFEMAIKKIAREWASLPGSPYGQPVISWDRARAIYASAGGSTAMA